MEQPCLWCGKPDKTISDWLIYPTEKGEVPQGEDNHVACCRSCRAVRAGKSVAGWMADCRESSRSADPQIVYGLLKELDDNHKTDRTGVELRQMRRMLDLQFNAATKRLSKLGKMFDRYGSNCVWCGLALSPRHLESSYEHVIPQSRQGSNHHHNLLPACIDCNNRRSNKSPANWLAILLKEGQQPRIDLVWCSLIASTGPEHGVRMHKRATTYLDEMELLFTNSELMIGQPYLPDLRKPRPPVAAPRKTVKPAKSRRRRARK